MTFSSLKMRRVTFDKWKRDLHESPTLLALSENIIWKEIIATLLLLIKKWIRRVLKKTKWSVFEMLTDSLITLRSLLIVDWIWLKFWWAVKFFLRKLIWKWLIKLMAIWRYFTNSLKILQIHFERVGWRQKQRKYKLV